LPDTQNEVVTPTSDLTILDPAKTNQSLNINHQSSVIALDIGGSKIASAMVDQNYLTGQISQVPTVKTNFADFFVQVKNLIDNYLNSKADITAIAIALPGVLDDQGKTQFAGGNLPYLTGHNLKLELGQYYNLPIAMENDARCFTLGEVFMGAGRGYNTVVGITWGTGIGAGIVIDGQIFKGAGSAGEIGHIPVTTSNLSIQCGCGKANCLEVYASGAAIVREYHGMGGSAEINDVAEIVHSQEVAAIAVLDQAVIFMAEIIVAVINCLDPDCIIIGGGLSQIDDRIFNKLRLLVANQEIRSLQQTIILKKQLPNAALIGATKLARQLPASQL
jgi:predicted NBD/HSP70 family sugar kinase